MPTPLLLARVCSGALLVAAGLPAAYLFGLALASIGRIRPLRMARPRHRFAIAIPAHNEAAVIAGTVAHLCQLDYPRELFTVHVVADHCDDDTAALARAAGAIVHERHSAPQGSKGAALRWLFERILGSATSGDRPAWQAGEVTPHAGDCDALVVFDADTLVAPDFLRVMDARLAEGDAVIQGQHRIRNPEDGWFPALTAAMFLVDNRFQNLGRTRLGLSAKNMGDSICLRVEVLRELGWGDGLTEDYAFRQQLLLSGRVIAYEPRAVGYGEAPLSWRIARAQRARWVRGTHDASRRYARRLLREALRRRNLAIMDGALQAYLPAYSTLALGTATVWLCHVVLLLTGSAIGRGLVLLLWGWSLLAAGLVTYPLLGLALEQAKPGAYLAMLSGPLFVVWRTWLAVVSRLGHDVTWIKTPRRGDSALPNSASAGSAGAQSARATHI